METIIGTLIFFSLLFGVTKWFDRRSYKRTECEVADTAIRTLRPVAKRRAQQASMPIPFQADLTPVHGVPLQDPTPPAPPGQYSLSKGGKLKILKR